jgi:hypothetical protein
VVGRLVSQSLPSPGAAASSSWFTAAHVALVVSIAALVVTIVVSAFTLYYLRRSTTATEASARAAEDSATSSKASVKAAEDSATSARVSAQAAEDSAGSAKGLLKIERDREHDRTRPKLRGRLVPEPDISGPSNAWLEVHLDASALAEHVADRARRCLVRSWLVVGTRPHAQ